MSSVNLLLWSLLVYRPYSATINKDLNVTLMSHLGDLTNQYDPIAVEILQDGTIVIAANGAFQFNSSYNCDIQTSIEIDNSSSNSFPTLITIERESNSQFVITKVLRLSKGDTEIDDLCSNGMNIVAIGSFGIIAGTYSNEFNSYTISWKDKNDSYSCDSSTTCKCDMGSDNTIVAFVGSFITNVYDFQDGSIISTTSTTNQPDDVAIDTISGSNLYYIIGWRQVTNILQIPWIFARSYTDDTSNEYTLYNIDGTNTGDTSDARGVTIQVYDTKDGNASLWIQGKSSGGVSVWRKNPTDLSITATQIQYDDYTRTTNTGGTNVHYTAKLDSKTGQHYYGQFQQMRLSSNNKGNTMNPIAMAIDVNMDRIYYAQQSGCCLQYRDELSINNKDIGGYAGSDALLWITNIDLTERYFWTSFTKNASDNWKTNARDIATNKGIMAFIGIVQDGGSVLQFQSFQGTSNHNDSDAGFVVIIDNYYGDIDNVYDNALCGIPSSQPTLSPSDASPIACFVFNVIYLVHVYCIIIIIQS